MSQRCSHRKDYRFPRSGKTTDALWATKSSQSHKPLARVEASDLFLESAQGYSQCLSRRVRNGPTTAPNERFRSFQDGPRFGDLVHQQFLVIYVANESQQCGL